MAFTWDDPSEPVGARRFVTAYSTLGDQHDIGRVIAYTDAPTFTLEKPDGTRFSWRVDLCDYTTNEELTEILNNLLDKVEPA